MTVQVGLIPRFNSCSQNHAERVVKDVQHAQPRAIQHSTAQHATSQQHSTAQLCIVTAEHQHSIGKALHDVAHRDSTLRRNTTTRIQSRQLHGQQQVGGLQGKVFFGIGAFWEWVHFQHGWRCLSIDVLSQLLLCLGVCPRQGDLRESSQDSSHCLRPETGFPAQSASPSAHREVFVPLFLCISMKKGCISVAPWKCVAGLEG